MAFYNLPAIERVAMVEASIAFGKKYLHHPDKERSGGKFAMESNFGEGSTRKIKNNYNLILRNG